MSAIIPLLFKQLLIIKIFNEELKTGYIVRQKVFNSSVTTLIINNCLKSKGIIANIS